MNVGVLIAITICVFPFFLMYSNFFFPIFLLAPFYSLPLLVILKRQDIGTFSIGFQILALMTALGLAFRNLETDLLAPGSISLILLSVICAYGVLIPQTNPTPLLVKIIACKSILFPSVVAFLVSRNLKIDELSRIVKFSFYICLISSLAGVIELQLGTSRLIALGLPYGANGQIREFQSGRVRALGLSLTNFEFSLFSGLVAIIAYAIFANWISFNKISKTLAVITFISTIVNMYTSITRQGIFFPLIAIGFLELRRQKNAIRLFSQIYFAALGILGLILLNSLFLSDSSLNGRLQIWKTLTNQFGKFIGNGIGFCGGATTSSYAKNISQLFVDNYYVSIFLQVGILGLILYIVSLSSYMYRSNTFGKSIVFAIALTSLVTEFWEYTSIVSLALIFISSLGNVTLKKDNLII